MNLEAAIRYLNEGRSPLPASDVATITNVMSTIGATEFECREDHLFFADADDQVHVHRTMIVAQEPVPNSIRTDTYPKWPYRVELSGWRNRSHSNHEDVAVKLCQDCFNPLSAEHDDGCY